MFRHGAAVSEGSPSYGGSRALGAIREQKVSAHPRIVSMSFSLWHIANHLDLSHKDNEITPSRFWQDSISFRKHGQETTF